MHVHLPKPLHGWRAFLGEVGIIVHGVLIALGAEQVVESIHQRYLARQVEDHIRAELAYDSAFASQRVAIGDCIRASIIDLRQRLLASGDNWPGLQNVTLNGAASQPSSRFAVEPPLSAPEGLWPTGAWATATSSGAVNRDRSRFFSYAALYSMVDWFGRIQDHEIGDYAKLMPFDVPQKLDPSSRLQLLSALGALDADNATMERLASVFVTAARHNGVAPSPAWLARAVGEEARGRGACVKQGAALDAAIARDFKGGAHL